MKNYKLYLQNLALVLILLFSPSSSSSSSQRTLASEDATSSSSSSSSTVITNTQQSELDENAFTTIDNDDVAVSVGIKSFTVEVMKPTAVTENEPKVALLQESISNIPESFNTITTDVIATTASSTSKTTTGTTTITKTILPDITKSSSTFTASSSSTSAKSKATAVPSSSESTHFISDDNLLSEFDNGKVPSSFNLGIFENSDTKERKNEEKSHEAEDGVQQEQRRQSSTSSILVDVTTTVFKPTFLVTATINSSTSITNTETATTNDGGSTFGSPSSMNGSSGNSSFESTPVPFDVKNVNVTAPSTRQYSTQEPLINDIHVEKKLENGLYRIKLAEITTDEFNGGSFNFPTRNHENKEEEFTNDQTSDAIQRQNKNYKDFKSSQKFEPPRQSLSKGKINIADLYPSKLEDFKTETKESDEKILEENNKKGSPSSSLKKLSSLSSSSSVYNSQDDGNMLPNELLESDSNIPTSKIEIELIDGNENNQQRNSAELSDKITDFTGKLQEQDGIITEIEKKFQLDDLNHPTLAKADEEHEKNSDVKLQSEFSEKKFPRKTWTINPYHPHGSQFIDRRVKKSFDFSQSNKRQQSESIINNNSNNNNNDNNNNNLNSSEARNPDSNSRFDTIRRIDFANTKFNTDSTKKDDGIHSDKPEFSTTKFYNSRELYNEMMNRKSLADSENKLSNSASKMFPENERIPDEEQQKRERYDVSSDNTPPENPYFVPYPSMEKNIRITEDEQTSTKLYPTTKGSTFKTTAPTTVKPLCKTKTVSKTPRKSSLISTMRTMMEESSSSSPVTEGSARKVTETTQLPVVHYTISGSSKILDKSTEKENEKSPKSSIKLKPNMDVNFGRTTSDIEQQSTTTQIMSSTNNLNTDSVPKVTPTNQFYTTERIQHIDPYALNSMKAIPKILRKSYPRVNVLTRLQEKMNSLECEIQNVPQDSHLWRGNETHELLLPITTPENCKTTDDCSPMIISWEGQAEIQSGDVLLVEINDSLLTSAHRNEITEQNNTHKAATKVYQVTRPGHEHCDVTEGVLLDITPLVVDGKKLVTLYDKDLTEGINLLIVVSELWGSQCVRLKVTVKSDNCGENADCSSKGVCFSNESMEGYECQCCSGFAGAHCEEIDACSPSPCTNNGICVDLSQGHEGNAYQCLCPYGYTGKNCQYESDPCNPAECMNGGSCVGNSTHFRCDCAPGYTGPLCQHNLNECESSPCVHGICVDQEDGFRCFCQPGFAGELCNFEYNECESNPCLNGGQCIDQIGGYECKCTKGYQGNQCQVKVDFCANNPCPEGHTCVDHGDDFTCECPGGRNGPDCNHVPRTLCTVNPCANGGTCWTSEESFYCACRPGYTGKVCEDEFVVETVVSSSEFMIDDTSARNGFNDKNFGNVVTKSPIELHNAYIAAGTLAAAIFIVAVVVTICHCKVHQTYRRFSTRQHQLIPIFGFGKRIKSPKSHRHWLSGKGGNGSGGGGTTGVNNNGLGNKTNKGHLPGTVTSHCHNHHIGSNSTCHHPHTHQIHDKPFQRHLAMNLENDMYYTVDFSDSQHSPLIQ